MVAVCGNGAPAWNQRGCDLGKVAIWAFHGDADPTVNVSGSTTPLDGLAECPSPPRKEAKLTIYPGVTHDSWTRTYNLQAGHDIYAWLLQQHK
jgi:predicted peptidase